MCTVSQPVTASMVI